MKDIILIATIKDWNINNFYEFKKKFEDKYNLYLITNKDDLIRGFGYEINKDKKWETVASFMNE